MLSLRPLVVILTVGIISGGLFFVKVKSKNEKTNNGQFVNISAANRVTETPIPSPPSKVKSTTLNQDKSGDVIIPKIAGQIDCAGETHNKLICFRDFYSNLIQKGGVKIALSDIKARYDIDPFVRSQCHQLTHVIGREAAILYPTAPQAFAHGDSFCWSGYYHGAMEALVSKVEREEVGKKLDSFCVDIPGKKNFSFDYYNCVHGLGHGAMSILNNELPSSLALCDNLTGAWEKSSCWSGVFMENIIADEINHVSKYLKDDDPLYPCDFVDGKYKNTCYLMQTSRMLALVQSNFAKVFDLCSSVEEPYIDTCYQSLGRDASGRSVSNLEQTKTTCLLGKNYREQSNCIVGAVKDFISYFHSDKQALGLCSAVPKDLEPICLQTVSSYYKQF